MFVCTANAWCSFHDRRLRFFFFVIFVFETFGYYTDRRTTHLFIILYYTYNYNAFLRIILYVRVYVLKVYAFVFLLLPNPPFSVYTINENISRCCNDILCSVKITLWGTHNVLQRWLTCHLIDGCCLLQVNRGIASSELFEIAMRTTNAYKKNKVNSYVIFIYIYKMQIVKGHWTTWSVNVYRCACVCGEIHLFPANNRTKVYYYNNIIILFIRVLTPRYYYIILIYIYYARSL